MEFAKQNVTMKYAVMTGEIAADIVILLISVYEVCLGMDSAKKNVFNKDASEILVTVNILLISNRMD